MDAEVKTGAQAVWDIIFHITKPVNIFNNIKLCSIVSLIPVIGQNVAEPLSSGTVIVVMGMPA